MAGCGGCARRRQHRVQRAAAKRDPLLGPYKNLPHNQIKARLENYKKHYCKECDKRYDCDYKMYLECKKNK